MRRFKFVIHHEEGSWWAESEDLPRWYGTADTLEELRAVLPEAVEFYFEDEDERLGLFEVVEVFAPAQSQTQA